MRVVLFLFVVAFFSLGLSQEVKKGDKVSFVTVDGERDLKDVTVTQIMPDAIQVMSDSGIFRIHFTNIPEDLRLRLGLKEDKAREFDQKNKNEKLGKDVFAELCKLTVDAVRVSGKVFQVLENGVLAVDSSGEVFYLASKEVWEDDDIIYDYAFRFGTYSYITVEGDPKAVIRYDHTNKGQILKSLKYLVDGGYDPEGEYLERLRRAQGLEVERKVIID